MAQAESLIRNISDTALLAAVYRARETDRQDALFRDPFAGRLAGKRGDQIADSIPFSNQNTWAWVTRTYIFDQFIAEQCQQGVDMVVNLAAGLDTRPYRMLLPSSSTQLYNTVFISPSTPSVLLQHTSCRRISGLGVRQDRIAGPHAIRSRNVRSR